MNISKTDFDRAAGQTAIGPAQAEEFWRLLQTLSPNPGVNNVRRFDFAHLAYYFGAFIVIGAMGWFMTNVWEDFGGLGIMLIALAYALVFAGVGVALWRRAAGGLQSLGGVLVTVAVCMTPLAIYGLQRWTGSWPGVDPGEYSGFHEWIKGGWIYMELGTLLAGIAALRFVRFPFLTLPLAFALWYLSMDLTPVIFGTGDDEFLWSEYLHVSLGFGLAMLVAAYVLDVSRRWQGLDYGFWLSLFGLLAFWGGLSLIHSGSEADAFLYGLINVGLMLVGVLLDRRAFVVFGALGVNGYIGHLAWRVFAHSLWFPFVLSALGVVVIVAGVIYARRSAAWRTAMAEWLPAAWRPLLPETARAAGTDGTRC